LVKVKALNSYRGWESAGGAREVKMETVIKKDLKGSKTLDCPYCGARQANDEKRIIAKSPAKGILYRYGNLTCNKCLYPYHISVRNENFFSLRLMEKFGREL
jgi:hypothetical protein